MILFIPKGLPVYPFPSKTGFLKKGYTMAKIIDLKTRQVLANLPSQATPKRHQGYVSHDILNGKVGIIALDSKHATDILNFTKRVLNGELIKKPA